MHPLVRLAILGTAYCVLGTPYSAAADWPRFRGPNGTGVVPGPIPPLKWSASENVLWKADVPGSGHSSPIVVKGRVFLQTSSDDASKRLLLCYDAATGKLKWSKSTPGHKARTHAKSSLASSTPASDGERVYALFWDGSVVTLYAYDLDGAELWSASLGGYVSQHGAGMSPVAHGGKVFVNYDQDDPAQADKPKKGDAPRGPATENPAEVLAFDAKTGAKVWTAKRKAFRACSSSPFIRELPGGKAELVVSSTAGLTGYDTDTGKPNWDWVWKFNGAALRTVGSPVLVGDVVVVPSGDGGGSRNMVAVAPGPKPRALWSKLKETPYVPAPVAKGDHLYWVTDGGLAVCAELKTGKVVWSERAFENLSKGTYVHASLLLAGDNVVAVAETGRAVVFKTSPTGFEVVAENDLGETVDATPAAADGRLYIRGAEHLFCIGAK
ncbi:MAG TPA: PQQ-binding-like beta-propeller repeat protein [Gemmataceae bacterium]|nr:PQQ-binding-like beta-propeller repeat protein [Gemmataceae bacterium]